MSNRPIIMTGHSIVSVLDGTKIQTRRVITPQPADGNDWTEESLLARCPYGQAGDRLWVKETFGLVPATAYGEAIPHRHDPKDAASVAIYPAGWGQAWEPRKRSPRFMPRWASRLTLEVVDVRVERVQNISLGDALREGISPQLRAGIDIDIDGDFYPEGERAVIRQFAALWDSINRKRGFGWGMNPWCFAMEFKVAEAADE